MPAPVTLTDEELNTSLPPSPLPESPSLPVQGQATHSPAPSPIMDGAAQTVAGANDPNPGALNSFTPSFPGATANEFPEPGVDRSGSLPAAASSGLEQLSDPLDPKNATSSIASTTPTASIEPRPNMAWNGPLVPAQTIQPIDLLGVLRFAGANDIELAMARQRMIHSLAELDQARVLWLPSLFLGANWMRHDGQLQDIAGRVLNISKSALFVGGSGASGPFLSGPIPAGGPVPLGGLTAIVRISDAIFEPLAARRISEARKAAVQTAAQDALLDASESYFEMQRAVGQIALAREAATHASALAELTGSYARSGAGLEADRQRAATERDRQRRQAEVAVGRLEVASAELVRRLRLDPRLMLAPVEPPELVIRLIPLEHSIDELIGQALQHRPELAQAQSLVAATLARLQQAKVRPFVPSVALRYSGGGFGGGRNEVFDNFNLRSDAEVSLYWQLQNLGLGDHANKKARQAEHQLADLEAIRTQDRIAAEVMQAYKQMLSAQRQIQIAAEALPAALRSVELNFAKIQKGAGTPLEALQPIQALAQARADYLDSVLELNRAQFRLYRALGRPPMMESTPTHSVMDGMGARTATGSAGQSSTPAAPVPRSGRMTSSKPRRSFAPGNLRAGHDEALGEFIPEMPPLNRFSEVNLPPPSISRGPAAPTRDAAVEAAETEGLPRIPDPMESAEAAQDGETSTEPPSSRDGATRFSRPGDAPVFQRQSRP